MSDKQLNLGVIGTGKVAKAHINNIINVGRDKIVAVADLNDADREEAAAKTGAQPYEDFRMMIDEHRFDAVLLMEPPGTRFTALEMLCERRVPMICEKPPASSNGEAFKIADMVGQSGTPVAVSFIFRYLPAVDRLKELLGDRTINLVQSRFLCPAATEWNRDASVYSRNDSGGPTIEQVIYALDLIRYVVGEMHSVNTIGSNIIVPRSPEFTIEDSSTTLIRFDSGATGSHTQSWAHHNVEKLVTLIGEKFSLSFDFGRRVYGYIGDEVIDETFDPPPEGLTVHNYEMQAFLDCVRTGDYSSLRNPFTDSANSLAAALAMNESLMSAAPVLL